MTINQRVPQGFLPNQLPGCVLWLRADQGLTLNNTNVSQWNDLSGQGQNFSQGTTADQPLWTPNGFNGLPGVTFNGSTTFLSNGSLTYNSASPAAQLTVFVALQLTSTVVQQYFLAQPAQTGFDFIAEANTNLALLVGQTSLTTYTNDQIVAGNTLMTVPSQINCVFNAATASNPRALPRVNRVAYNTVNAGNAGTPSATTFSNGQPVYLGQNGASTAYFTGTVAEVVVCNQQLTAAQISWVESYMQKLWGLP